MAESFWIPCHHFAVKFSSPDPEVDQHKREYRERYVEVAGSLSEDEKYYELIITLLMNVSASSRSCPMISVAGSQGSGKSTFARLLATVAEEHFQLRTTVLSMDDFYCTRRSRQDMQKMIHPLLIVRGVPGTHDIDWMVDAVQTLRSGEATLVPTFDKSRDDRVGDFRGVTAPDLLICEGWCWGATPQTAQQLVQPINSLEEREDSDGRWRKYVNEQLKHYQPLFDEDISVFLAAPSMEAVVRWRLLQESEMPVSPIGHAMSEMEIQGFVAYYERITRSMLETQIERVDVCVELNEKHSIDRLIWGNSASIQ